MRGRTTERRAVASAVRGGKTVAVVGPAGIGKTTLVRAVLGRRPHVEGPGLVSLRWRPYSPLSIALCRELSGDPDAVAAEVRRLLGNRVLFVDDLQWVDDRTRAVLGLLSGRVPVVVTARPEGIGGLAVSDAVIVELAPLPPTASRSLAAEWHPELGDSERDRLVALAGGSPLLLRHLAVEGQTSPTLRAAAAARLNGVEPAAAAAVRELAVLGRPVAASVLTVSVDDLPDELVVVGEDHVVALRHPLLGEATLETLDADALAATHRSVAARLPSEEAAVHHLLGGDRVRAFACTQEALANVADPARRAHLLGVAARACDDDRWKLAAAEALVAIGDWAGATAIAEAVSSSEPAVAAEAALHVSRGRWFAGDIAGARESLRSGLDLVERRDGVVAVRLLVEEASQRVRTEEATAATTPIAEAALAAAVEADVEVPRARLILATAQAHDGRPGWETSFRQAMEEAAAAGDAETECAAAYYLASHLGFAGRGAEAVAILDGMAPRADALGLGTWRTHMEAASITDHFNLDRSPAELVEVSRRFLEDHPRFRNRAQLDLVLALSLADGGRHEEAAAVVDARFAEQLTDDDRSILLAVASELAWLRADPTAAIATATQATDLGPGWFGITVGAACAGALARLELGDRAVPPPPAPAKVPFFARLRELVAALHRWGTGDDLGAVADLDELTGRWAALGNVRYQLATRWAAALILRRRRDRTAHERLTTLLADAEASGRRPIAWRASVTLAIGDPSTGLTEREMAVLALVGEGCSSQAVADRLGITRSTVESHVRSARRKLGATTRWQAVTAMGATIAS